MTREPDRAALGADGSVRKAHYGDGLQPWDHVVASGWGPAFAAGNVLKYLRRTKDSEASLEKARWYYARLYELAAKETERLVPRVTDASDAVARLELLLTRDELTALRREDGGRP